MNPFHIMVRSLMSRLSGQQVDLVLHTDSFGPLIIKQLVTGREHSFVMIRVEDGRVFSFHLEVISAFPLEVRPSTPDEKASTTRRIGFQIASSTDDNTDL